jgi:S-adenosylmethionine:diacylglycerol 3-amino-3-carboxypropyl transferase
MHKTERNSQVHWNPIYEEMKAKAKQPLTVTSRAIGRSVGFPCERIDKVHLEFGIVALDHNLMKVVGIRPATFTKNKQTKKQPKKNHSFFLGYFTFRDLSDSPVCSYGFLLIIINLLHK